MARYDKDKERFDAELSILFKHMAEKLDQQEIASVDVLSTTALHEDWPESKIAAIEDHFFTTHEKILRKQTNFFSWNDWIKQQEEQIYQRYYKEILDLSKEGSEWYDLMLKTHNNVAISADLEISLKYQRREYAAIRMMNRYTDLVYMGRISSGWSYLYKIYGNKIPRFVRASIQTKASQIENYDAAAAVKIVTTSIEEIVSSPNFPPNQKEKLKEICENLFRTYIFTIPTHNNVEKRDKSLRLEARQRNATLGG
jgi:hypothetical protein